MTTNTILLLLLSIIVAGGLSFYQYIFKAGNRNKINLLLALLRFISIFGLLLLLINPVVSRSTYETEKTPLPIVVDNSASVKELKADAVAVDLYKKLVSNKALQEKFDVQSYRFTTRSNCRKRLISKAGRPTSRKWPRISKASTRTRRSRPF